MDDRPADQPPVRDRARPHIVHLVHIHVGRRVTAGSGPPQRGRDLFTTTLQTTDAKNLQDLRLTGVVDGQPKQRRLEAPPIGVQGRHPGYGKVKFVATVTHVRDRLDRHRVGQNVHE